MDNEIFPIPLGGDRKVQMHGIPSDFTQEEARQVASVILALGGVSTVIVDDRKEAPHP